MGFTRYWERAKQLPARKFVAATNDCRRVVRHLRVPVQFEYDNDDPARFGPDYIRFNGVGEDGHETFFIHQEYWPSYPGKQPNQNGLWFDFCKTARKPYDACVTACLVVFKHHFGDRFLFSSDGNDEEAGLPEARKACQEVLGYGGNMLLAIAGAERFTRRGMAYRKTGPKHYKFSNGFHARVISMRTYARENVVVTNNPYSRPGDPGYMEFLTRNITEAQWRVTIGSLRQEMSGSAVDCEPFLAMAAETPGNWSPLLVLADKLEESNDYRGSVLRAHIPT